MPDPLAVGSLKTWPGTLPVTVGWSQYTGVAGWVGDASWNYERSQVSSTLIVHHTQLERGVREILGHARLMASGAPAGVKPQPNQYPNHTDLYKLSRTPPMRHPQYTWMYASEIVKVEGVGLRKTRISNELLGVPAENQIGPIGSVVSQKVGGIMPGSEKPEVLGHAGPIYHAEYYKITVLFTTPLYRIVPDHVVDEWNRFVIKLKESTAEYISHQKGSMQYVEGTWGTKPFKGTVGWTLNKDRLRWTWLNVPEPGIMNDNRNHAPLIDAAIGKVNAYTFAGYPPGTLLMEAPKWIPRNAPMAPSFVNQTQEGDPPRVWDIEFSMVYFNPPTKAPSTRIGESLYNELAKRILKRIAEAENGKRDPEDPIDEEWVDRAMHGNTVFTKNTLQYQYNPWLYIKGSILGYDQAQAMRDQIANKKGPMYEAILEQARLRETTPPLPVWPRGHNLGPHPFDGFWYLIHSAAPSMIANSMNAVSSGGKSETLWGKTVCYISVVSDGHTQESTFNSLYPGMVVKANGLPPGTQITELLSDRYFVINASMADNAEVTNVKFYMPPYRMYDFARCFGMLRGG